MRRKFWLHGSALIFFAGLAILILYPILIGNGSRVAGFDFFNYNWNFWWIRHAFSTPGFSVYQSDFVFFPILNNFGYHALTAFWYPVWAVLEPLFGTLTAVTVIIFIGCFLNGYLLYVWMRSEGVRPVLALIGGAALQALPISRYFYYNTHLNLMDWFWLPGMLLLWKAIVVSAEARRYPAALVWALIMGVGIWGLGLTDLQFPIFAAFVVIPYGLWTLWRSPGRLALIPLGIAAVLVGGSLLWFAGPLSHMLRFTGVLVPGPAEERPGIPFPMGFLTMNAQWWEWSQPSTGAFVTIVLLISLAAWRLIKPHDSSKRNETLRTTPLFWLIVALPPLLLSLGADLHIGDLVIPMPYRLMHAQTNGMFRMPWRLAPIFVIAAMVFAGQVWTLRFPKLNESVGRRIAALTAVFLFLVISVRLFETAPLQEAPLDYRSYHEIAAERGGDYDRQMILQVPIAVGTGEVLLGDWRAIQLQYYSMITEKRGLNGFVSRAPIDPLWEIYTLDPLWAWLGGRAPLDSDRITELLRDRIFNYPIGYIVIHSDLIGTTSPAFGEMIGYLNGQNDLVCPPSTEGNLIVYRTRWHPDGCAPRTPPQTHANTWQIDIGGEDTAYLGMGWHWRESIFETTVRWVGAAPEAELFIDLPPRDCEMRFNAQSFWEPRTLTVMLDDTVISDLLTVAPDSMQSFAVDLNASALGDGVHRRIRFVYDAAVVPVEVGQSADERALAVMIDTIDFICP